MSNTFKKSSLRGFTLIELLVVIAIIGLLSTIIAAPIQSARKKARDVKKIAEVKSTQLALEQYAESNQAQYPRTLVALSPQFMPLLSSFASATTSTVRDAFGYTTYTASSTGGSDRIFSYHIGAKLEMYGPALETDRDCWSATLSNALIIPFCAVYNGYSMYGEVLNNGSNLYLTYKTNLTGSTANLLYQGQDFQAATSTGLLSPYSEYSSSTCVTPNDCIFDVTSQQ